MRRQCFTKRKLTVIATKTEAVDLLTQLFRETGSAHHKAFSATNGDDPEWAIWYAKFLQPKLNVLFSTQYTKSQILHLLLQAERNRSAITPNPGWPEFYARLFIKELDSSHK